VSLRVRFALSVAIVAAFAALIGTALSYQATASRLSRAVDDSLEFGARRQAVAMFERGVNLDRAPQRGRSRRDGNGDRLDFDGRIAQQVPGGELLASQWLDSTGAIRQEGPVSLPVTAEDRIIAAGASKLAFRVTTTEINGVPFRIRTLYVPTEGAVQVARDVSENRTVLRDLLKRFALLVIGTSFGAAGIGWLLARSATHRLVHLEALVTQMATTGDLSTGSALTVSGKDETARVSIAFARLTSALRTSQEQQQRLVEDASHELRTPLTSLRTNLAVLPKIDRLSADDRAALVSDVQAEVEELVILVEELVSHATATSLNEQAELLDLSEIAAQCIASVRRRTGRTVNFVNDDSYVNAGPASLQRAITNLLANAVKFDSSGGAIEVTVASGSVSVRDHGPGFVPADLPRVFDRFYRADAARTLPGSGLGLSIVADVAERFGGTVKVENDQNGGARVTLHLPNVVST
jgi:two-component system, OmpR family, sensor histidine kinase MprB